MNLIEPMKHRFVFDLLESYLIRLVEVYGRHANDLGKIRATARKLQFGTLKITNLKVTSKDKNKYIITFDSNKDRYKCIWDFAEQRCISRSVKR